MTRAPLGGAPEAPRGIPWIAIIVLLFVLGVGSFVLVDMKPWAAKKFQDPRPKPTLKILGRDDPATLKAQREEEEEERRLRRRPLPPASGTASTPAPQNSAAEPSARPH
ncbi:MAG: hypothetical protein U0414_05475 [Polyangiaceae bacterium]